MFPTLSREATGGGDQKERPDRHPKENEGTSQELETRKRIESRLKVKKEVGHAIITGWSLPVNGILKNKKRIYEGGRVQIYTTLA